MSDNEYLDYDIFERDWKKRHKASLPRKVSVSGFSTFFWIAFWLIVATGAAVFSAAHTIPAAEMTLFADSPNRSLLASTVFVIVELLVFGAAVYRHQIWWMKWLLLGALLVALIANTSSSVRAVEENGGDILNQVAGVLLSIIAPFTALAAGEVLHLQIASLSEKRRIANEAYQQQWKEVEAKINTAFTKAEKELKAVTTGKRVVTQSVVNSGKSVEITSGNYQRNATEIVYDFLRENPDAFQRSNRDLASELGVSHPIVGKVKNELSNGNNHHS